MWTMTTSGFFSVVKNNQVKGEVLVRARCKADIWNLYREFSDNPRYKGKGKRFKMTAPKADEKRDYRWRISLKQKAWAEIVYRLAMRVDYCNFKNAVHGEESQQNKSSAYLSVWSALYRVQVLENEKQVPEAQGSFGSYLYGSRREDDAARSTDDYFGPMDRWLEPPTANKTIKSVQQSEEEQHQAWEAMIDEHTKRMENK